MALDKNYFDDRLKDKPWRDLVFRATVWFAISGVAAYLALNNGVTAFAFLERMVKSVGPLVNKIGTVAVILAAPALALKDLEHVAPDKWGQNTRRGRWGGAIRRLAGDLLLWTLGAFSTLLSAITVAVAVDGVDESGMRLVAGMITQLLFVAFVAALLTIGVRRAGPSPLIDVTTRVDALIVLYFGAVGVAALWSALPSA